MGGAAQAAGSSWDPSPSSHPRPTPLRGPTQRQAFFIFWLGWEYTECLHGVVTEKYSGAHRECHQLPTT